MMILAIVLFVLTYIGMLVFPKWRPYIALGSAVLFVVLGIMPVKHLASAINWNVLMMIAGTMGVVALMIDSKMPARLADMIVAKVPNVKMATFMLSLFAGIVSAFIDNVATVLMIAPIALEIAKKQKIDPVGMIIAIAVSSNLQGAATLVGDTTSIMLGGYAGMNFLDFFFFHGKPSIFWAVELGALCASCIILILFRKDTQKVDVKEYTEVECYFPTVLMCLIVVLLIAASLIPNMPDMINGYICMILMIIGIIYHIARKKKFSASLEILKEIDFETLLLLFSLFIVVGGITEAGVIDKIAEIFTKISGGSLFVIYSLLVWMSVVFSAFIDNIPYVMTMLPVTKGIALSMGVDPTLLYFGLLSGATLGGNLTPVGASANIAAIGILRKNGYQVKNKDFFRIGVPFTLAAIIPAYIYFWLIYA